MFWILVCEIMWNPMLGRSNLALQTHKHNHHDLHWMPCITSSPGHFSAGVAGRSKRRGRARVLRGVSKWSSGAVCRPGMQDTMRTKHLLYLSCIIYTIYIYMVNRRIPSCKIKRIFEDVIVKQHICGNKCRTNFAEDSGWTSHAGFAGKPNPVCVVLTPCQPTKTSWGIKWHQSSSIKVFIESIWMETICPHSSIMFHHVPPLTLEHALLPPCSAMSGEESRSLAWRRFFEASGSYDQNATMVFAYNWDDVVKPN